MDIHVAKRRKAAQLAPIICKWTQSVHFGGAVSQRVRRDVVEHRQKILDAARKVFGSMGFQAPLDAVVQEAGLGRGTLYRHFPTRATLALAVLEHELDGLLDAALAMKEDPQLLPYFLARRSTSALVVLSASRKDDEPWKAEVIGRLDHKIDRLYALIVDNAIRLNVAGTDFDAAKLRLLRAMTYGVEVHAGSNGGDDALHTCIGILLKGLRPDPE